MVPVAATGGGEAVDERAAIGVLEVAEYSGSDEGGGESKAVGEGEEMEEIEETGSGGSSSVVVPGVAIDEPHSSDEEEDEALEDAHEIVEALGLPGRQGRRRGWTSSRFGYD